MSTVTLARWGNSIGIRIPATIVKESHLVIGEELEIRTNEKGVLTLIPIKNQQEGWTDQFNAIADTQNNQNLLDIPNEFDKEEWSW